MRRSGEGEGKWETDWGRGGKVEERLIGKGAGKWEGDNKVGNGSESGRESEWGRDGDERWGVVI